MAAKIDEEVYWIGGHGFEIINRPWKVPKGCTIVVNTKSGQLKHAIQYENAFNIFSTAVPLEHLQDPSTHFSDIIDAIKLDNAFTIYKENEMCPTFIYELTDIIKREGLPYIMGAPSGVINIKQIKEAHADNATFKMVTYDREFDLNKDKTDAVIDKISDAYKYSSYPTKEDIQTYLSTFWKEKENSNEKRSQTYTAGILLDHLSKNDKLKISQSDLCDVLGPGIYYHFVCRQPGLNNKTPIHLLNEYNLNIMSRMEFPHTSGIPVLPIQANSIVSNKLAKPYKNIFRSRINESLKRKPYIKNYFTKKQVNLRNNITYNKNMMHLDKRMYNTMKQSQEMKMAIKDINNAVNKFTNDKKELQTIYNAKRYYPSTYTNPIRNQIQSINDKIATFKKHRNTALYHKKQFNNKFNILSCAFTSKKKRHNATASQK